MGLASTYAPGHKQRVGDMRTPEGWYRTSDKPWSSFYAAIAIHYPEAEDAHRGVRDALITAEQRDEILDALQKGGKPPQNTRLGGEILIHGGGGSTDWTLGCVALDDPHIDALRAALQARWEASRELRARLGPARTAPALELPETERENLRALGYAE